jgi:hypothetical protein
MSVPCLSFPLNVMPFVFFPFNNRGLPLRKGADEGRTKVSCVALLILYTWCCMLVGLVIVCKFLLVVCS